jgi:hypothetical protein
MSDNATDPLRSDGFGELPAVDLNEHVGLRIVSRWKLRRVFAISLPGDRVPMLAPEQLIAQSGLLRVPIFLLGGQRTEDHP